MKHGFSLVELSIVLVILGLLTGGILAGQSLIRASELRAVTSEFNRYVAATHTFRDKYFALPGDMTNATKFWGAAHATPATCVTTTTGTAATCDGNGNGFIDVNGSSNEAFRYWQQLANAGLVEGSYSGVTDGSTSYSSTYNNSPRSKISNATWLAWSWGTVSGDGTQFDGDYRYMYIYGGIAANNSPDANNLKPEELWNIDTKLDDGKPGTGKVIARPWGVNCNTATSSTNYAADYSLSYNSAACRTIFRAIF